MVTPHTRVRRLSKSAFYLLLTSIQVFIVCEVMYGQASELTAQVQKLQQAVGPVQTGAKSYEQKIIFNEPTVLRYSFDETDQEYLEKIVQLVQV